MPLVNKIMKIKNLAIIAFSVFAFLKMQAQVTFKPGIHAGINISKFTNSGLGNKTDFYVGGFGALKLSKFYTLQAELTYSRQGAKGDIAMGSTEYYDAPSNSYITIYNRGTVDASLQYISELTINKFNFTENFYFLAGPFFDILIAKDIKVNPKEKGDNYNKGQDVDLGIVGGLGYSLKNGISFEARIKKGLTDSFTDYYADGVDTNNLVFQFGATYTFAKK